MNTTDSKNDSDLARVSDSSEGISSELESGKTRRHKKKAAKEADDKRWSSSAQEQLERFKGVPVVGGLPWRLQYIIAAAVLAVSVLALIALGSSGGSSGPSPALTASRMAAQHIVVQAGRAATGQAVNASILQQAMDQGTKATKALGEENAWRSLNEDAAALSQRAQQLGDVFALANSAHVSIEQALLKNPNIWQQIEQEGTIASKEAAALGQAMGAYRSINAQLQGILLGGPVSDRLAEDVQTVNNGFAAFRVSPLMGQDTYLTRAWRELASSWTTASPSLEKILAAQAAVNQRSVNVNSVAEHAMALEKTLAAKERASAGSGSRAGLLFVPALLALASLGLLLLIAWKQHRWQLLSSRYQQEQNDTAFLAFVEGLNGLGQGDLTARLPASTHSVGTIAESINQANDNLQRLVQGVKKALDQTKTEVWKANEATGMLIASQRQRALDLDSNSQSVLQLIELVGVVGLMARQSKALVDQVQSTAMLGQTSVSQLLEKISVSRERVDEASGRTQRLVKSSSEISGIAESVNSLSERLGVVGIQAALHAAKAGEAGRGFKIVADEIQKLSAEAGAGARHVTALVETELSDLEALAASVGSAQGALNESVRLSDSSNELWNQTRTQLNELLELLGALREQAQSQEQLATSLDTQTRSDLAKLDSSNQEAQGAADAMRSLVSSIQATDVAISKIKA